MMTKAICLVGLLLACASCSGASSDPVADELYEEEGSVDQAALGAADIDPGAVPVSVDDSVAQLRAALSADGGVDGGADGGL